MALGLKDFSTPALGVLRWHLGFGQSAATRFGLPCSQCAWHWAAYSWFRSASRIAGAPARMSRGVVRTWFLRAFLGCPVSLRCAGRAGRFFLWHGGAGQNPRRTRGGFPAPWKLRPASKPDGGFAHSPRHLEIPLRTRCLPSAFVARPRQPAFCEAISTHQCRSINSRTTFQ